jgi:spore maturation protein CgeB
VHVPSYLCRVHVARRIDKVRAILPEAEAIGCFDDVDQLITLIDECLDDEARRSAHARRGFEIVTAAHSWEHRIGAILDRHRALARVLDTKERRAGDPV